MNLERSANCSVSYQLSHLCMEWCITIVESYTNMTTSFLSAIYDSLGFSFVGSNRLLCNNIAALLHSPHYIIVVGSVYSGNDDYIWLCLIDHLLKLIGRVFRDPLPPLDDGVCIIHTCLTLIAESHKLINIIILSHKSLIVHSGSSTDSNFSISLFHNFSLSIILFIILLFILICNK